MGNQTVLYEQSGNIVTITYNRPDKQNAINGQMRKELNDAWDKFSEDETGMGGDPYWQRHYFLWRS